MANYGERRESLLGRVRVKKLEGEVLSQGKRVRMGNGKGYELISGGDKNGEGSAKNE